MSNRKVPKELKILRGTWRGDRDGPKGAEGAVGGPLEHPPRPPAHLGKYGRQLWRKLVPELLAAGMLREHHLPVLEPLCSAYELYREAQAAVYFQNGRRRSLAEYLAGKRSSEIPEYRVMKAAFQDFRMYLLEFGLTPASVGKVPVTGPAQEEDPIERMMKGRGHGA